jgi:hypothetical protein
VDDLDTAPPIAGATRDPETLEAAHQVAVWALIHRVAADPAKTRGVRALLRSTDGDFRITADRVDGELVLTIEARREQPSGDGGDDAGAQTPDRG